MHACGLNTAAPELHSVSWAADLDRDSQVILTSDLCTQLHGTAIVSHRQYRGHLAGIEPPCEAGGGWLPRQTPPDRHTEHIAFELRYRFLNLKME